MVNTEQQHRLQLTLSKPLLSWRAKPTVVIDGRGQPAQWGVGTWQIPTTEGRVGASGVLRVFVFNRLWRFGSAVFVFGEEPPETLVYTPPVLPFFRGRLSEATKKA